MRSNVQRLAVRVSYGLILVLSLTGVAAAQTWNQTAAGTFSWNVSTSPPWAGAVFPNAVDATANLNIDILGNQTINLNVPITIGTLNVGDSSGAQTTVIAPAAGSFLFDVSAGSAAITRGTAGTGAVTISAPVALNDSLNVANNSTGVFTMSGGVSGTGNLTLNHNTATANGITLSTATVNHSGTITNSGVGPGSTLISAIIGGNVSGLVQNSSTSQLTLSGNNAFTGGVTIKAGTVSGTTSANAFGGAANTIFIGDTSGAADATLSGGFNGTFANPINVVAGSSGLAIITSTANTPTFSGAVTLNKDLRIAPAANNVILSGGMLGTANLTIATSGAGATTVSTNMLGINGSITNSGTGAGLSTISSALSSNLTGLTQNSATSQLTVSGINYHAAPNTITAGTLSVANKFNLGAAAANLIFDGGTLQVTGGNLNRLSTIGHAVSLIPAKTVGLDVNAANHVFVVDQVLNQTTGGFTKLGNATGVAVLQELNTYSGVTNITGGILRANTLVNGGLASSIGQSGSGAGNLLIGTGATLQYAGTGGSTDRLFTINGTAAGHNATIDASGSGAINYTNTGSLGYGVANQTRTLIFGGTNTSSNTFAPIIENNGTGLTSVQKSGGGTWQLTNAASTYTGTTTINDFGGVLEVSKLDNGGLVSSIGQSGSAATNLVLRRNTTLRYTGSGDSTDRQFQIFTNANENITLDASGSGAINFTSTASLTHGNNNARSLILTGTNTGANRLAAAITNPGAVLSLVKSGAGSWTISGANTFTGATTISGGGTLNLDYSTANNSKLSGTNALALSGGTVNLMGGSFTDDVGSTTLAGQNNVTRSSGSSVLRMNGITPGTGSVNFGADDIASTSTANNAGGILGGWATVGGADWATNSGVDDGGAVSNSFIRAYTGYADVTRLMSGPQVIADGSTTNVRIIEGTGGAADITLGSPTTTVNTLNQSTSGGTSAATIDPAGQTLAVNAILIGSGAGALTIGNGVNNGTLQSATGGGNLMLNDQSGNSLTINSVIANNGGSSLTKTGNGTATLNATNNYTGVTTVSGGILNANATGAISGAATVSAGTLNANASSTIAGTTTVSGGTLNYGANDVIADGANVVVSSGTMNIGAFSDTVNGLTLSGGTFTGTTGTLSSNTLILTQSGTASGVLGGSVGIRKNGGGTMTVIGLNTFTGNVEMLSGGGTFIFNNISNKGVPSAIGAGTGALSGNIYHNTDSTNVITLIYSGPSATTDRGFYWNTAPGTTTTQVQNGSVGTFQVLNSGVTLELLGSGSWSSGANKFFRGPATGLSNLNFGTITLFNVAGDGGTITADPTLNINIAGLISATNSAATNFFFNGPTNSIGAINFSAVTKTVAINGAGTTTLFGANNFGATASQIQVNNGIVIVTNTNSGAAMTWNVGGSGTLRVGNGGSTGTLSGNVSNAGQLIFNRSDNNLVAANNISGAGNVQQVGSGRTTLSGTNTNTGLTVVTAGTLQFKNEVSLYNNVSANWTASRIIVEPAATLALNVGDVGEFTAADIDIIKAIGTTAGGFKSGTFLGLDTSNAVGNFVYNSNIANPNSGTNVLGLTKLGGGTLQLGGTNTYTGTTGVRAGTLLVNGTHTGGGLYTVDANGTLGGTGSTDADVLVYGVLAAGNSIESLGTGSLTLDGAFFAGLLDYEMNTDLATADLVYGGTGSDLTLNSALLLLGDLGTPSVLPSGTKFTMIAYDGTWNGGEFFELGSVGALLPDDSTFSFAGNTWLINYNDTTPGSNFLSDITTQTRFVTLTVSDEVEAVPEPATWALAALGLLGLGIYAWRRK